MSRNINKERDQLVVKLRRKKKTYREIAKILGIHFTTVPMALKRENVDLSTGELLTNVDL